MSDIKFSSNASGTGVITVASPNTNTDRTINIPDDDGTILLTDTLGDYAINVDPTNSQASSKITMSVDGTERVRIDSDGRVGIGTTALSSMNGYGNGFTVAKSDISGSAGMTIYASANTGYSSLYFGDVDDTKIGWLEYNHNSDNLAFGVNNITGASLDSTGRFYVKNGLHYTGTSGTDLQIVNSNAGGIELLADQNGLAFKTYSGAWQERMTISDNGNVGINNTSPSAALHVVGLANPTSYFQVSGNGNQAIIFENASSVTSGYITVNSSSVSYNTSSDYRLKTDIQPMTGATERLKALKPVNFEWIESGERVDGFIAHEAAEVVPEAVTGTKDGMKTEEYEVTPAEYEDVVIPAVLDAEGNEINPERTEQRLVTKAVMGEREVPDYQGIDQSKLVPLLVATIQELEARIAALETA